MGSNYRPQGSEKIQDPEQKLARIREISGITSQQQLNENKYNTKTTTVLHEAVAADGKTYGLIQEGSRVHIKHLVNERYEFLTGDEKDYAYRDFAQAFKHLNLLFKDISQRAGYENSINLFEGGLTEKKNLTERFVLKQPVPQAPVAQDVPQMPSATDAPPAPDTATPPNPEASQQLGQEFSQAEQQMEGGDPAKAMQKMVGKLTQQMRSADDQTMTSEFQKSILNSVISAIRIDKMEDADVLSVIRKLKGEDNAEAAGGGNDFVDDQGVDYNVNNPQNQEQQDTKPLQETEIGIDAQQLASAPIKRTPNATFGSISEGGIFFHEGNRCMKWDKWNYVHPSGKIQSLDENMPVFREGVNRALMNEEVEQPVGDDQTMPNILSQVVKNLGVEINPANENDVRNAVELFVRTYDSDQNQTGFMEQLKDYLNSTAAMNENSMAAGQLRYSSLSPMGQQVFDQLEVLDPSMGELSQDANIDASSDSHNSTVMATESKHLRDIINEALNVK